MAATDGGRDRHAARGSPWRRLAVLLVLLAAPWTVILVGDDVVTLVFLPALVDYVNPSAGSLTRPLYVLPVWDLYLSGGGPPRDPELWPASALLFLVGLASAASGALLGREDARVTACLCLLAAGAHLGVTYAFSHRPAYAPFPVAPVLLVGVVWWYYGPALRAAVLAPVAAD